MGINKRYIEKFSNLYSNLKEIQTPIYFTENSIYYRNEEWMYVLSKYIPDVIDKAYMISTYGNVYTNISSPLYPNGGLLKHSINPKGYHQINLATNNGAKVGIKITKLMMLHYRFIPGCELLEVDHIDGNKDHNYIWNLEWVTPQENTHRAIINNQRKLSVYKSSGTLLSAEQADNLFIRAYFKKENFSKLAHEYNVSEEYINRLLSGEDRPYIRKKYIK